MSNTASVFEKNSTTRCSCSHTSEFVNNDCSNGIQSFSLIIIVLNQTEHMNQTMKISRHRTVLIFLFDSNVHSSNFLLYFSNMNVLLSIIEKTIIIFITKLFCSKIVKDEKRTCFHLFTINYWNSIRSRPLFSAIADQKTRGSTISQS